MSNPTCPLHSSHPYKLDEMINNLIREHTIKPNPSTNTHQYIIRLQHKCS